MTKNGKWFLEFLMIIGNKNFMGDRGSIQHVIKIQLKASNYEDAKTEVQEMIQVIKLKAQQGEFMYFKSYDYSDEIDNSSKLTFIHFELVFKEELPTDIPIIPGK